MLHYYAASPREVVGVGELSIATFREIRIRWTLGRPSHTETGAFKILDEELFVYWMKYCLATADFS